MSALPAQPLLPEFGLVPVVHRLDLVRKDASDAVRSEAARALAGFDMPKLGSDLLAGWKDYPKALRPANNGGPTFTSALLPGSPAIDTGSNLGCPATDQRGIRRPINGDAVGPATCDLGAYEALVRLFMPALYR